MTTILLLYLTGGVAACFAAYYAGVLHRLIEEVHSDSEDLVILIFLVVSILLYPIALLPIDWGGDND